MGDFPDDFASKSKSDLEKRNKTIIQGAAVRALVVTQNITVDGSIEMLGDWFDPQGQGDQSDLLEELHRQDRRSDAFLTGRQTFEDLRSYWPQQSDDTSGITKYLNEIHKYVVSSTLTDPQWQNTTVLSGDPVQQVQALKEQQGLDIVVTGSITLCHTLISAGLVDEYRLFVYPVVQGRGRRLFPDGFELPRLTLLQTQGFRNGVTYSRYTAE
jgi:dihydrofolate reductase